MPRLPKHEYQGYSLRESPYSLAMPCDGCGEWIASGEEAWWAESEYDGVMCVECMDVVMAFNQKFGIPRQPSKPVMLWRAWVEGIKKFRPGH